MGWLATRTPQQAALTLCAEADTALVMLCLGLVALEPAPVLAQTSGPPTPTITHYDEDWSTLEDSKVRAEVPLGDLKYIPLGGKGAAWLTTGAEVRLRNETFNNNDWGASPAPDDGYLLLRAMPYADLHVGPGRFFVELIAADAVGVEPAPSPVDATGIDILQAFAEVRVGSNDDLSLTLRGGRELLSLGSQRLVGTRYGPNVPLAFDGGRALLVWGPWKFDLLYARPVQNGRGSFDDRTSARKALWGAYVTRALPIGKHSGIDLYYLGYRNDRAVFDQGAEREIRHSVGARLYGSAGDWTWNWEGLYQFGHFGGDRIAAWAVGMETGRQFPEVPLQPNVLVRIGAASGDGDARDHKLGTFNPLFPKGKYFGELSPLGPYNILSVQPGVTLSLGRNLSLGLVGMAYWRQSVSDGIYDMPGNLLRSGQTSRARFIGREAELTLNWVATPTLSLSGSFSVFQPGTFIRETGPAKTITMIGLETSFVF